MIYKGKIYIFILFYLDFKTKQDIRLLFFCLIYHTRHKSASPPASHIIMFIPFQIQPYIPFLFYSLVKIQGKLLGGIDR